MINRRSFLLSNALLAGFGLAGAVESDPCFEVDGGETMPGAVYEFVTVKLQFGAQMNRFLGWTEKRALPLFRKHHFEPVGFFTVDVGPDIPALFAIRAYPSLAEMDAAWARVAADPDWTAALAELETEGPAFYREESALLVATPFSPPLKPAAPSDPAHKVFELRIYESPTYKQLGYLHERFAGGEIDLFHKSGIHPLLYADTVIGPKRPNMAYLIPFESEAHREKAWSAFRDNPDWQRLRDESIRRGGEIVRNITNLLLVPTSFSMLR